jgi:hypothetical protein
MNEFERQLNIARHTVDEQQITIDLSVAVIDKEYRIAGNYFYVKESPDSSSYIGIKRELESRAEIPYSWQTGFRGAFTKLYITTPAGQAGNMTIIIAAELPGPEGFEIIDNRSQISAAMNDILEQLRGGLVPENWGNELTIDVSCVRVLAANVNRKAFIIQSKSSNTAFIYVNFDNSVADHRWIAQLQPGMSFSVDNYRGEIWVAAADMNQLLGYGEW